MKKFMPLIIWLILISFQVNAQFRDMSYWRPYDKRGINIFETSKNDTLAFQGIQVRLGGSFAQQFQAFRHSNTANERFNENGIDLNKLVEIGPGFNLATANLNLDVMLADGIRLNLITYLSSRHHPEAWVKGGYLQVDKVPFLNSGVLDEIFKYTTVRVGHMEINYGDAHFRRSDNAHALYNPFVESYIMDAFTTEIGAEVYFQRNGLIAMVASTGGEIQGGVTNPGKRKPAYYGKVGYDGLVTENVRVRLTGSLYTTAGSVRNTLYAGDRTGSRYYMVMENGLASTAANFTSGRLNPNLTNKITSVMINPFVKVYGLEVFGNLERAKGAMLDEVNDRTWDQIGLDLVYRFGNNENLYVAGRYNTVKGSLPNVDSKLVIDRTQFGAGWFVTKNILAKLEYVNQQYKNFQPADIRNGGEFKGFMLEGVIAF